MNLHSFIHLTNKLLWVCLARWMNKGVCFVWWAIWINVEFALPIKCWGTHILTGSLSTITHSNLLPQFYYLNKKAGISMYMRHLSLWRCARLPIKRGHTVVCSNRGFRPGALWTLLATPPIRRRFVFCRRSEKGSKK